MNLYKEAKIDTYNLPIVYRKMVDYLRNFYNKYQSDSTQYEQWNGSYTIYNYNDFDALFKIDLTGWSGLDEWYKQLINRKYDLKKKYSQLVKQQSIIENLVLDPQLCLRNLSTSTARQIYNNFWNSIGKQDQISLQNEKIAVPQNITVVICDKAQPYDSNVRGKYIQGYIVLMIAINVVEQNNKKKIKTPINIAIEELRHQFIHFLDHITGLVLKSNFDKIIKYKDISPQNPKEEQYSDYEQKLQPLSDAYNKDTYKEYEPIYQQFYVRLSEAIKDMHFYHNNYFYINKEGYKIPLKDESELLFCHLTNYNTRKNEPLNFNIIDKVKQINKSYGETLEDLFDYIIKNDMMYGDEYSVNLIDTLKSFSKRNTKSYLVSMKRYKEQFSSDFIETTMAKKVL